MKKLGLVIALAGVLAAPTLQASMTVVLNTGPFSGGNNGGEFTATPTGWSADAGAYSIANQTITASGVFQTFCVEVYETFVPGSSYNVALSTVAVLGGNNPGHGGPAGPPDPMSRGTAWLYSQFASGTLAGYAYGGNPGRVNSATDLQVAIWALEDENGWVYNAANPFMVAAAANFGGWGTAQLDAVIGVSDFSVRVMNLTDANGGLHQDNLVVVPEPTTLIAGALLLLPFGASTLRMLRRNRTA